MESDQPNTENEESQPQLHYTGPPTEGVKISAVEAAVAAGMTPSTSRAASEETINTQSEATLLDWTDPPTGAVPRILLTDDEIAEIGEDKMKAPIWRESGQDWNHRDDLNLGFMQETEEDPFVADGTRSMASMPTDINFDEIDLLSLSEDDFDSSLKSLGITDFQDPATDLSAGGSQELQNENPSPYYPPVHFDYVEDDTDLPEFTADEMDGYENGDNVDTNRSQEPHMGRDGVLLQDGEENTLDPMESAEDDPFAKLEEDASPLARLRKRKKEHRGQPAAGFSGISSGDERQAKGIAHVEPKHFSETPAKNKNAPTRSEPKKAKQASSSVKTGHTVGGNRPSVAAGSDPREQSEAVAAKRNPVTATVTGLVMGAIAIGSFLLGPQICLALIVLLVILASGELLRSIKQAGYRPASVLALVAVAGLTLGAYFRQLDALVLVIAASVICGLLWYMFSSAGERPAVDLGLTLLVIAWVGGLASFGALLLAPGSFPHRTGVAFFASAIILAAANDVGAYVVGALFGKHLLSPKISPKKSVEGFLGGTALTVVFAVLVIARIHPLDTGKALVFALAVVILAPLGDLAESLVKRDLKIKDMGSILPAHGGILDRVDGILFVLPAIYYLVEAFHLV